LPDLSPPYGTQGKIVHRAWFSPDEYKPLYTATREHAKTALSHRRWNAEPVDDFVLFLANTGLRPDEAKNLQHRDVKIVKDEGTGRRILAHIKDLLDTSAIDVMRAKCSKQRPENPLSGSPI
jgi:integrase